jgi:outer membrane protein assembly factor BamA
MFKPVTYIFSICLLIAVCFLGACSNTRYLPEGETLYVGNQVRVADSSLSRAKSKDMEKELSEIIRPRRNRVFLGIRFKLWVYNVAGAPKKESGIRYWLRNKMGEAPVFGSDLSIDANTKIINNYLQNQGYFRAFSTGEKVTKKEKTKAFFVVNSGPQSLLNQIVFTESDSSAIGRDVAAMKDKTLLHPDDPYNLEVIKTERERISQNLKNNGYYYFNPNYVIIIADTGIGNNRVDLRIKLKTNEMPASAFKQYYIHDVLILPNYRLKENSRSDTVKRNTRSRASVDTVVYEGFKIVDRRKMFKSFIFHQAMQLRPGDIYNVKDQNIALNRLVTLGTFKFVKNEFGRVKDTNANLLNLTYYLTPYPKKVFNAELGGFTQNDSRAGSRGSISWRNRNFLRGAELFTVKLTGGFEAQYGGVIKTPNTYNLGLETSLNVPRFIVPFFKIKPSSMFIPRTLMTAAYNYSLKRDYYKIYSLSFGFGYNWKEDATKEHNLFPFNLSIVKTDTLNADHASEINLTNLVFNGIILGPSYEYTYNSQLGRKRIDNYYFNGAADFSGNILGLAQGTSLSEPPKEIFGSAYAQYIKLQADFRYYHNYDEATVLATRIFLGFGLPYGNSQHLPNIKQFFSGGSSSLRGFSSRLVGPGTFNEQFQQGSHTFVEMLGDMKLEANAELRMKIYQFIHAAVFADAGNIWLYRDNPDFPGGTFSSRFYQELAVDAGLGLRFDFSILILRLDLGIPLRKPWYPEGTRWQFNNIRLGDAAWRGDNLFLNLAIGYPF